MSAAIRLALDTSVAVPALLSGHPEHERCRGRILGPRAALSGHSALETYAVLTRLPLPDRLTPVEAGSLLDRAFEQPLELGMALADAVRTLAAAGIAGGATYDGLVALAARAHGTLLLTRDMRAKPVYDALGVDYEVV